MSLSVAASPEGLTADQQRDVVSKAREVKRGLTGRVPRADDEHALPRDVRRLGHRAAVENAATYEAVHFGEGAISIQYVRRHLDERRDREHIEQ